MNVFNNLVNTDIITLIFSFVVITVLTVNLFAMVANIVLWVYGRMRNIH